MTGPGRLCPSPPLPKQGFLGPLNWLMDGSAAGRQVGPQVAGLLPHWAVEGPPHVLLRAMPVHSAHGPSGQTRMSPLHWPAVALRQGMRQPVAGATPPGPHPPPPSIAASPPKQGRGACGSVAFLPGEARFHPGGYAPVNRSGSPFPCRWSQMLPGTVHNCSTECPCDRDAFGVTCFAMVRRC